MRIPLSAAVGVTCLALAACGGSDKDSAGNAAASATFTYGSSSAADETQAGSLEASLSGVAAFAAAPAALGGITFSNPQNVTIGLLGPLNLDVGPAGTAPVLPLRASLVDAARALAVPFENPACVTATPTSVTLTACRFSLDLALGGDALHGTYVYDGSVAFTAANHTVAWDLRATVSATRTGTISGTGAGSMLFAGSLTATATTVAGHMESRVHADITSGGRSWSAGVDESLDVNVTYADAATCPSRVTGGTLEAKRVWTERPAGTAAAARPDAAAKVTWTACGQATVQHGTR